MDDFGFGVMSGISPADNARITVLENNEYKVTYYEVISGTSGSLTVPSQATINAGEFGLSGNAILSKIDGSNKPTFQSPTTSGGVVVTASLNASTGAWTTSGTYTDSNVALIYSIKIKAVYYSNLNYNNIIETAAVGVVTETATQTLTNKTIIKRILVVTQSATPSTNIDNGDIIQITGLAQAITSMTTNLTGTPYDGQMIMWQITDNGTARAITWGASFASTTGSTLPTTTVISTMLRVITQYNLATSKHECQYVN